MLDPCLHRPVTLKFLPVLFPTFKNSSSSKIPIIFRGSICNHTDNIILHHRCAINRDLLTVERLHDWLKFLFFSSLDGIENWTLFVTLLEYIDVSILVAEFHSCGGWNEHGGCADTSSPWVGAKAGVPWNETMRRGASDHTEGKSATGMYVRGRLWNFSWLAQQPRFPSTRLIPQRYGHKSHRDTLRKLPSTNTLLV